MRVAPFDRLQTIRLARESQTGRGELCREPDGTYRVKLCIKSEACQREILDALDQRIPVRLENGALELLASFGYGDFKARL